LEFRQEEDTQRGGPSSHKEWTASLYSGRLDVKAGNLFIDPVQQVCIVLSHPFRKERGKDGARSIYGPNQ
jgi:hypothetical protein